MADDLISYYKFDADANDSVGGKHLTVANATISATAVIDHSYYFNGSNAKLSGVSFTGVKTISMWFRPYYTITTTANAVAIMGDSGDTGIYWYLGGNTSSSFANEMFTFQVAYGKLFYATSTQLGTSEFTADTWYHLVWVWSAADSTYRIYLNGTDCGLMTNYGGASEKSSLSNFTLGMGEAATYFKGYIDEYALWSRSITGAEVTSLYGGGSGWQYPFVVPAPVAAFSGTPLTGYPALSVTFTDASTNTPTSWSWEKKETGSYVVFSTDQNPTENFNLGTWDVKLTATNAGGSDSEEKLDYIITTAKPISILPMSGTKHSFNNSWKFKRFWKFKFF